MLGKTSNWLIVTHPSAGGLFMRGSLTLVTPLNALVLLLSFCGAAGQCTMCQESITGDWTYWDADCGTKLGDKCLSDLGDWMTWDGCCSVSGAPGRRRDPQPVPGKTDSHGNVFVRLNLPGLEWVTQLVHERPDAPPLDPNSIVGLSQALPLTSSEACDCSFARAGGCGRQDHSRECWDTCCAAEAQATSVWEGAKQKLRASVFSSPLAWACTVAFGVLMLNARRVTVAIGHVTAKAAWNTIAMDVSEEDVRGLIE